MSTTWETPGWSWEAFLEVRGDSRRGPAAETSPPCLRLGFLPEPSQGIHAWVWAQCSSAGRSRVWGREAGAEGITSQESSAIFLFGAGL